jgi:hypothetical protein
MARTKGSTDARPRQRRQETQKEKEKKVKEKQGRLQRESQKAKASFLSALTAPEALLSKDLELEDASSVLDDDLVSTAANPSVEFIEEISGIEWRGVVDTQGIVADLDYDDEDVDIEENETNTNDILTDDDGVMPNYLSAIQQRIRKETAEKNRVNSGQQWLLQEIQDNGYWIRKERAKMICRKLSIRFDEPSYYRDLQIWFPELEGGIACTPSCPSCSSNTRVSVHGYRNKTPARNVVCLTTNYFIMSRRYICQTCKASNMQAKNDAAGEPFEKIQYTFMGYNSEVLRSFPFGFEQEFPAFLTRRAGVDLSIIDLMRPLFDKGVRPTALSDLLLELHAKKYTNDYIKRERLLERDILFAAREADCPQMFSGFADKSKYDGRVPTGRYLQMVYTKFHASIRPHFDREVKKRGAKRLHIDASFKAPKHLCQYKGKAYFKALITATNECREVRLQCFSVSDSHDQLTPSLAALLNTHKELGQETPELAYSDNPGRDQKYLLAEVASLRATQDRLDRYAEQSNQQRRQSSGGTTDSTGTVPVVDVDMGPNTTNAMNTAAASTDDLESWIKIASATTEINGMCDALREHLENEHQGLQKVLALDIEWDTKKNRQGMVIKSERTSLIQLGYEDSSGGHIRALLFQVSRLKRLPDRLAALLRDQDITFVGAGVSGDLKKIGRDFDCGGLVSKTNFVNLGSFARERDVVQNGCTGLDTLSDLVLNERLDKSADVRLSDWSSVNLSHRQKKYAGLDATKSLQVYLALLQLPNLTSRLSSDKAMSNLKVDIVPAHGTTGSVGDLATRAAIGTILEDQRYVSPTGFTPSQFRVNKRTSRVILVTEVLSPSLLLKELKDRNGRKPCLADFGPAPFKMILPLNMLKNHVASDHVRNFDTPAVDIRTSRRITAPAASTDIRHQDNRLDKTSDTDISSSVLFDSQDDEEYDLQEDLVPDEHINIVQRAELVATTAEQGNRQAMQCEHLDAPPDEIDDCFSAIVGDPFHGIQRPKVPIKHDYKKPYHVAAMKAWFAWDENKLKDVIATLKENGWTDEDVKSKMYYSVDFFRELVERQILPPRQLYWRVRAVYVEFGNRVCSKSGKPLFGKYAWEKANNILREILKGYWSDPPGFSFYTARLGVDGQPKTNQYGLQLLDCNRGTNDVENDHKQYVTTFGTWHTGIQMSDCLLAERRHRHNQRMSERYRSGFPRLGHYDSWKVDLLQILVQKNHGRLLYPYWVNASDFRDTPESFNTVALHSSDLDDALKAIRVDEEIRRKFSPDLKHLCLSMGIPVPFLPCHGIEEAKLFSKLMLQLPGRFDAEKMSIEWCKYVDGVTIFPKLPVYLRSYREAWEQNRRVRDAVKNMTSRIEMLEEINKKEAPAVDEVVRNPTLPPILVRPTLLALRPAHTGQLFVGNTYIGVTIEQQSGRKTGKRNRATTIIRGEDIVPRKRRQCKRCREHGGTKAISCKGRSPKHGAGGCEFFDESGGVRNCSIES